MTGENRKKSQVERVQASQNKSQHPFISPLLEQESFDFRTIALKLQEKLLDCRRKAIMSSFQQS